MTEPSEIAFYYRLERIQAKDRSQKRGTIRQKPKDGLRQK